MPELPVPGTPIRHEKLLSKASVNMPTCSAQIGAGRTRQAGNAAPLSFARLLPDHTHAYGK